MISLILSQPFSFSPHLQKSNDMNVRCFVMVSQAPNILGRLIFPRLFSLCCSDWVSSITLSLATLILSSIPYILLLSPPSMFLFMFFFVSYIPLLRDSVSFLKLFVSSVFACWNMFFNAALKSLSDYSINPDISLLEYICCFPVSLRLTSSLL